MITLKTRGNFKRTEKFLAYIKKGDLYSRAEAQAKIGVGALMSATPRDTGGTAGSWDYEIKNTRAGLSIYWTNSNVVAGVPLVILLHYGHGTGTGGYVYGEDFINPAIKSTFEKIAQEVWKEVTSA